MTERILIVRCCRTARFAEAVRLLKARYPDADIWGLCHARYAGEVRAAGASDVVTHSGRRFGLWRTSPALWRRIRRAGIHRLALPYMEPDDAGHANVHRMALALGAREVLVLPELDRIDRYSGREFRRLAARSTRQAIARAFDVPLLLTLLLAARLAPRRRFKSAERAHHAKDDRPRRLRVLHVITSLAAGGAQLQLAELLARMPADRYDCDILVLNRHDGDFSRSRFSSTHRIQYLESWPDLSRSLWRLFRLCRQERYDIVHTWLFYANVIGAAAARLAGTPRIIASVRNMSLWKSTWYNKPWFRMVDVLGSRLADLVTVNGESLIGDHARWARYPSRDIRVVPNGLDPSTLSSLGEGAGAWLREQVGVSRDHLLIGTAGRLAPEKDQATFLHIVKRVHAEHPHVRAVIVGGGVQRPYLEGLARTLRLDGVVTFLGERADARRVIAGLDLFLLTSCCEGFPNVLLEAAFLGVPSIATDVGASREVLISADALFRPGDVTTGHRLVRRAIEDPERARARAALTRERALRRFTADRMAAAWLRVYELDASPVPIRTRVICEDPSIA